MIDQRVVIFGHARSGSTALFWALHMHPLMQMILEPFHESRETWAGSHKNYRKNIASADDLKNALNEIYRNHTGFKTLCYQLPRKLNEILLSETREQDRIIFIHRKNVLQAAVSLWISLQSNLWNVVEAIPEIGDNGAMHNALKQHHFGPIDPQLLVQSMVVFKRTKIHYQNFLFENKKMFLTVAYEELFLESQPERQRQIKKVYDFLGLFVPQREALKKIEDLFTPKHKMNNVNTYRLIPNIDVIEKMLGNAENGYLFSH